MHFLNVLMLGGLAAGIIPLAIHLLHRNKRRTVRWGALQLLIPKSLQQRRRAKFEHWLLLLLRILIPMVLALCMARPLLMGIAPSKTKTPTTLVVLLDDSASMGLATSALDPAFAAKNAVRLAIKDLPRGSEISILPMTRPEQPLVELTSDPAGALRQLESYTSPPVQAKTTAAFEAATLQFQKCHHARRRLLVVTDFQKSNWPADEAPSRIRAFERLRAQVPAPEPLFFDAGAPEPENTAVESLRFPAIPVGVGERIRFVATLKNYGKRTRENVGIIWKIDAVTMSNSSATLGAHESVQVVFEHVFADPGPHVLEVSTDASGLAADDSLTAIVHIHTPISILLVNGAQSPEPLQGETDFLEIALQPRVQSGRPVSSLLRPVVIEPGGLNKKALSGKQAVVLADTRPLSHDQLNALEEFVQAGGGLLFFPGRQTDSEWCNKQLHKDGNGLLPTRMGEVRAAPDAPVRTGISVMRSIEPHEALESFADRGSAFNEVKVQNWHELKWPDPSSPGAGNKGPRVILSLENGEPLLVERTFGNGRVIQSAIPCSTAWSNFTARPAFVPLMQRICLYAAATATPLTALDTGAPIVLPIPGRFAAQSFSIRTPNGASRPVFVHVEKEAAVAEFTDTNTTGIYEVAFPDGEVRKFALNLSRRESDPERLDQPELQKLASECASPLARRTEDLNLLNRAGEDGREIWQPLLGIILALLFAELWMLRRLSAPRREALS